MDLRGAKCKEGGEEEERERKRRRRRRREGGGGGERGGRGQQGGLLTPPPLAPPLPPLFTKKTPTPHSTQVPLHSCLSTPTLWMNLAMLARQGFGRVARELGRRRMSTGEEKILSEVKEGVAFLTLNDNSKRNAPSFSLMTELRDKIQSFEEDRSVKVAVLRHAGKVFSSGHDLKELSMLQKTVGSTEKVFAACSDLMLAVPQAPWNP